MHKKNHLYYYWENSMRKHDSIAHLYKYEKEKSELLYIKKTTFTYWKLEILHKKHILIKYKINCQRFGSETIKDYFCMFHRSFHRLKRTSDSGMWLFVRGNLAFFHDMKL